MKRRVRGSIRKGNQHSRPISACRSGKEDPCPGRVALHIDSQSGGLMHYVVMLRELPHGRWYVAVFTSDTGWMKYSRRATREEIALAGFVPVRTTLLGFTTKLIQELTPLPQKYPESRVLALLEELDRENRGELERCAQLADNLRRGETIFYRPYGAEVCPPIRAGQLCTVMPIQHGNVITGDLVLVKLRGLLYLRRVLAVAANSAQLTHCSVYLSQIYGKVTAADGVILDPPMVPVCHTGTIKMTFAAWNNNNTCKVRMEADGLIDAGSDHMDHNITPGGLMNIAQRYCMMLIPRSDGSIQVFLDDNEFK